MLKVFAKPHVDLVLLAAIIPLFLAGLVTMHGFTSPEAAAGLASPNYFFNRQLIWIALGFIAFFAASSIDWRILRSGPLLLILYIAGVAVLGGLLILANAVRGTQSWIQLGIFSIEPAEIMKVILILILAKYFSRRHIEIAHVKHIIISGIYAG